MRVEALPTTTDGSIANIFQCGDIEEDRYPATGIDADGHFVVKFSDLEDQDRGVVVEKSDRFLFDLAVAVDEWYHLEVDITRTQFQVSVNGVTQQEPMQYAPMLFSKYGSKLKHETKCVTCYLSNPWDTAANVEVTNLDYHKWNPTWDASYPPIDGMRFVELKLTINMLTD